MPSMCCKRSTMPTPVLTAPDLSPDAMSEEYRFVVEKAKRCFRLARAVNDPATVRLLEEMGEDYFQEAERLLQKGR